MRGRLFVVGVIAVTMIAPATSGDAEPAQACTWSIGIMGPLQGDYVKYGAPMANGIRLAVDRANREDDLACALAVHAENSAGDPNQAPAKAHELAEDEQVVACVCGLFSGETLATGGIFDEAGLAMLSAGTNRIIDQQGFDTWFRVLAVDSVQGAAGGRYIERAMDAKTVAVVHDTQDYSESLFEDVVDVLGDRVNGKYVINPERTDYGAVVAQIKDHSKPEAVYFGGFFPQAGPLLRQLREAGYRGPLVVSEGSKDDRIHLSLRRFRGSARVKATCPCADAREVAGAQDFVSLYRSTYAKAPRGIAADAFDATNIAIDALRELTGIESTEVARAHVVEYLDGVEAVQGTVKDYTWDDRGELHADDSHISVWKWLDEKGRWEYVGRISELI